MSDDTLFQSTTESVYDNPQLAGWLDSMEGVPEWVVQPETPAELAMRQRWQHWFHQVFAWMGTLLPGLALALIVAWLGVVLADFVGINLLRFDKTPLSTVAVAVLLGVLIRNTVGLPPVYESGLKICLRQVLRVGIVLLGLRLSLGDVGKISLTGLPIILTCMVTALLLVTWISRKMNLPRRFGTLIAVGTSICGVSAVVATAPIIEAEENETTYAVACVTLFGLLALLGYPWLAHAMFPEEPKLAGIFLGTAIHDTAQVAGAGLMYQQQFDAKEALDTATVVKLVRNTCMAAIIPLMVFFYRRNETETDGKKKKVGGWKAWGQFVPLFVLGFIVMAIVRTVGDYGQSPGGSSFNFINAEDWKRFLHAADWVSGWCLAMAMSAVGLGTALAKMKVLGWKPLTVGLLAALVVGVVSMAMLKVIA